MNKSNKNFIKKKFGQKWVVKLLGILKTPFCSSLSINGQSVQNLSKKPITSMNTLQVRKKSWYSIYHKNY